MAIGCALLTLACGKNDTASKKPAPSAVPSAAAPAVVRLRTLPWRMGQRFREERTSAFSLTVEFWQDDKKFGGNESYRSEEYARTSEVLGLVGGAPAKLRVTYDEFRLDETPSAGAPRHLTSLQGRSFVVDATDGEAKLSGEDGKALADEDGKELRRLHPSAGQADPVVAALGERPMKVGASGRMNKALLSALLGTGAGELQDGSFVLTASRVENGREVALFDCRATTLTEESGGLQVVSHLEIHAVVAVEPAETLAVTIKSALEAAGTARNARGLIDLRGSGWLKEQRSFARLP